MSGAAQRNDMAGTFDFPPTGLESPAALKDAVAERLAAHRNRRAAQALLSDREAAARQRDVANARQGASRVRDAVAARFETSVSYREYLAAEAERALQQAQAEAEVAARKAKAVAEVQLQLLEELEHWNRPEPGPRELALEQREADARGELAQALADIAMGARELIAEPILPQPMARPRNNQAAPQQFDTPASEVSAGSLTVRLYEEIGANRAPRSADMRLGLRAEKQEPAEFEMRDLDQEIEFRLAPEFEPHVIETTPIPGNIIQFPRQLIAARKTRPTLAEGPLRDAPQEPQLRIFEVEAEQTAAEPVLTEHPSVPEWQMLTLEGGAAPVPAAPAAAQTHFSMQPQTAPLELRLMAASVDACCLLLAFLGFAAVVVEIAGPNLRALPLPLLGASASGVLLTMFVLYQLLFFSLAEATPGMSYARIGLCTFSDDNPSRKAMRRRVLATLIAACPLLIGIVWTFLDEERLGWHDRMSRMYQRAY